MTFGEVKDYEGYEVQVKTFDDKSYFGILNIVDENTISIDNIFLIPISDIKEIRILKS